MSPTWTPRSGAASVAWEAVVGVQIPKAPRLPADLSVPLRGGPASLAWEAALGEVAGVLGNLRATLRRERLHSASV